MRKITAIIVLLSLLLASCGNTAPEETIAGTETNAAVDSAETESKTETASLLTTLPTVDYEGYTFTIIGQHTEERPNFHAEELTGDNINDALYNRDLTAVIRSDRRFS